MPESTVSVARQYAEAVFQLAEERNKVDRWLEELQLVAEVLSDPVVRQGFDSPSIAEEQKFAIARASLSMIDPLLLNFVLLLIRRRRLGLLNLIVSEFSRLVLEHRGIVVAEVTTAVPLDEERRQAIVQRLSSLLGKQVRLHTVVDPSIVGGLVVKIGDKLINGSVAGRLATLQRELV